MKNRTQTLITFAILSLIFAACAGIGTPQADTVEVTRVVEQTVVETVTVEGSPVEVTRVVETTVVETVEVEPYAAITESEAAEDAAEPLPPANGVVQPLTEEAVAPMPTALPTAAALPGSSPRMAVSR